MRTFLLKIFCVFANAYYLCAVFQTERLSKLVKMPKKRILNKVKRKRI